MGTVRVERTSHVAIVELDNPPVNALTDDTVAELRQAFTDLGDDRSVRAIVLTAQGRKAFCAGIDLNRRKPTDPPKPSQQLDEGAAWRETQHVIRHCPVPVIAAVESAAIGSGFGLVAVVDVIIAARSARFGLTEINVGLLGGGSKALRMVGPYKARMMVFSGELISAEEMYRFGAVEEVVAEGQARERAIEIAKSFARKSPIAIRLAKESLLRIEDLDLEDGYRLEQDYTRRLRYFDDAREAMRATREKREPIWTWS